MNGNSEKAEHMNGDADLRPRVVAMENWITATEMKISNLLDWKHQREIDSARHDEKWKNMDERFNRLDQKLSEMNKSLSWVAKLIIGGIILAIVAFLVRGGFAL